MAILLLAEYCRRWYYLGDFPFFLHEIEQGCLENLTPEQCWVLYNSCKWKYTVTICCCFWKLTAGRWMSYLQLCHVESHSNSYSAHTCIFCVHGLSPLSLSLSLSLSNIYLSHLYNVHGYANLYFMTRSIFTGCKRRWGTSTSKWTGCPVVPIWERRGTVPC